MTSTNDITIIAKIDEIMNNIQQKTNNQNKPIQKIHNISNSYDHIRTSYFSIHGARLEQDFKSPTNKHRRQLYRHIFDKKEQNQIFQQWMQLLNKQKTDIFFLDYVESLNTTKP